MTHSFVMDLLLSGMLYGTPLLIAALGELITERGGVLNLGIEGMMLVGAVTAYWLSQHVGGGAAIALIVGMAGAIVAGGAMALIHAFVTITMKGSQIVSGLALTIFGGAIGLSSFIGQVSSLGSAAAAHRLHLIDVFGLSGLPIVGPLLFHQNALVYASWALVVLVGLYITHTRFGLHLRAVGEEPKAADAMGINVARYRYIHTIVGGGFAGLGGACYTLAITPGWSQGITAGAGWIALALVIFAFWRPGLVLVGAYLFGILTSLGFTLQARGVNVPSELFSSLPYVLTIVSLVVVSTAWASGKLGAPKALGMPYGREDG